MKIGAERKQLAILGGILTLAAFLYWSNSPENPGGDAKSQASRKATASGAAATAMPARQQVPATAAAGKKRVVAKSSLQDFKPSLKGRKEALDPATVDPSLRLDLLAKVQKVNLAGGNRSLFDFGQAPVIIAKAVTPPKIIPSALNPIEAAVRATVNSTPPPAPKTPIPLKFFGFLGGNRQASKRAFFLEGEDIHVAGEGDLIRKRYKVIRIGLNSAVVEDTQQSYEQTLALEEPQQGS